MAPKKAGDSRSSGRPGSRPGTQGSRPPTSAPVGEGEMAAPVTCPPLLALRSSDASLDDLRPNGFVASVLKEAGPGGDEAVLRKGLAAVFPLGDGARAQALASWHCGNLRFCSHNCLHLLATAECLKLFEAVRVALCAPPDERDGVAAGAEVLQRGLLRLGSPQEVLRETVEEPTPPPPPPPPPADDAAHPPLKKGLSRVGSVREARETPPAREPSQPAPAPRTVRERVRLPAVLGEYDARLAAEHCAKTLLLRAGLHRFAARRPQSRHTQRYGVVLSEPRAPLPLHLARPLAAHQAWTRQTFEAEAEQSMGLAGSAAELELVEMLGRGGLGCDEAAERAALAESELDMRRQLRPRDYTHALGSLKYTLGKEQAAVDQQLSEQVAALQAAVAQRKQ